MYKISDIINVLDDEKCLIGSPCKNCIKTCTFRKTYSLVIDQEDKEKENESDAKGYEE